MHAKDKSSNEETTKDLKTANHLKITDTGGKVKNNYAVNSKPKNLGGPNKIKLHLAKASTHPMPRRTITDCPGAH